MCGHPVAQVWNVPTTPVRPLVLPTDRQPGLVAAPSVLQLLGWLLCHRLGSSSTVLSFLSGLPCWAPWPRGLLVLPQVSFSLSRSPFWTCHGWAAVPIPGRVFPSMGQWSGMATFLEQIIAKGFRASISRRPCRVQERRTVLTGSFPGEEVVLCHGHRSSAVDSSTCQGTPRWGLFHRELGTLRKLVHPSGWAPCLWTLSPCPPGPGGSWPQMPTHQLVSGAGTPWTRDGK